MRDDFSTFQEHHANIAVVARHSVEKVKSYWQKENLPYIGIPDPEATLGDLYHQQWKASKLGLMPALFIVDQGGKLVYAYYSNGMSDIPTNQKLFDVLKALEPKK